MAMIQPLALQRAHQEVEKILRDQITSGHLPPGTRLNVRFLAEKLDISPFPVREAIRHLEAVGLVKSIPHRGARVAWLNAKEIGDLFEYRLILEPEAARHAIRRMESSSAGVASLKHKLKELQDTGSGTDVFELLRRDEALLGAVFAESGNSYLTRAILQVWDNIRPYKVMYLSSIDSSLRQCTVQRWGEALVAACESGKEELVVQCVREPLELTKNSVVSFLKSLEGENDDFFRE